MIPKLRAPINSAHVFPATGSQKGVPIYVSGKLANMLILATGKDVPLKIYRNDGAGEGIRTLDPNLGKVVLYP